MNVREGFVDVIEKAKAKGIVEVASDTSQGWEFYILHRLVRESTKLRIVYDASAHANPQASSLNVTRERCLFTSAY